MDNFEKASRLKLRFETAKGFLAIEDLWDLPLRGNGTSLNSLAKNLNRKIKDEGEEDFVSPSTRANEVLGLQFDLVKHVIEIRLAEAEAAAQVREKKEKKQKLLEIISKKQDAALEQTPVEDLEKMLAEL
jgi:chemotaxis signal transduction protein